MGVRADQALQWLGTQRSALLTWRDGSNAPPSEITFSFSEQQAFFVRSTHDPDFNLDIVVRCEDRVEVAARMSVSTADGKLGLDKDKVRLAADANTQSVSGVIGNIDAEDLRGSYSPAHANECFLSTQLNVSFSADKLSGTMLDAIAGSACSKLSDLTGVGPRDGAEW